jgi:alpha-ketoglutarate-dependent taurine dioxygenase
MSVAIDLDIKVEPIKPAIGAVVHVDKQTFLSAEFPAMCVDLLDKCTALVFPELGLTDKEQLEFTDRLGERINFTGTVPGGDVSAEDVYMITLKKEVNAEPEYVWGSMFWHMDGIVSPIAPPKYTLLSCHNPPDKGGQTEFASAYAAWEGLPEEEKREFEKMRVVHNLEAGLRGLMPLEDIRPDKRRMDHEHPLVWTHEDGRKALLIGQHADTIVGMPRPQGRALLTWLQEWASQPDFTIRHTWKKGDFAIWDNTGALHRAMPYSEDSGREMHRTTVAGYEEVR